jgi:intracellular protein transport protein USO1
MLTTASWLGQKYNQLNKAGQAASAVETVKVLAERLKTASEPEDVRATVLSLKGLSRDYPKQIGDHALPAILSALEKEAAQPPVKGADDEIVRALVETCITLCDSTPPVPAEGAPKPKVGLNRGVFEA